MHAVTFPAPYDSMLSPLAWPIWWAIESIYLIRNKYSIVHACDFDTIIPAFLLSKIWKIPLFYSVYDYYSAGIPDELKFIKKAISSMDNFFISRADCVFLVDQNRLTQLKGCTIKDFEIINNSPKDVSLVNKSVRQDFTIFYAGALLEARGIDLIINLARRMPDIKMVIAGSGAAEDKIKVAMRQLQNIQFLGQISYEEVIAFSQRADALIALYDPSIENHKFASPNKLFEAMMLAKPIIVSDNPSLIKYIKEEKCGLLIRYGSMEDLCSSVIQLKNSEQLCQTLGRNGRNAYQEKYSWKKMNERLLSKYRAFSK
jgi:glycosyltransferase involved in cell wall biosynthesis